MKFKSLKESLTYGQIEGGLAEAVMSSLQSSCFDKN